MRIITNDIIIGFEEYVIAVGLFSDLDIPNEIYNIDHIDSNWLEKVSDYLKKSDYDFVITTNRELGTEVAWTIPDKLKRHERQKKLNSILGEL